MKNPFMTRKEHDRLMSEKAAIFFKVRQADKKMYENQAYKIRTELRRVLKNMSTVNISYLKEACKTWRLVLDFDPRPILFALERGDDEFMIDMIGEELKHRIIRKLQSLNIRRPESLGLER
jgi:hypothetical protein